MYYLKLMHCAIGLITLFVSFTRGEFYSLKFEMQHFTSVSESQFYASHVVSSTLACSVSCARDNKCTAFYVENTMVIPKNSKRVCSLISERVVKIIVSGGNGSYGYLVTFLSQRYPSPPVLSNGVLHTVTQSQHGVVAIYNCSVSPLSITNIALLYKHDSHKWPEIGSSCLSTLCGQFGLAATFLDIDYEQSTATYQARVICQNDEIHSSDATCGTDGIWTLTSPLYIGCIPSTCYRNNINGRAFYKGTESVSKNNIVCQRWDKQTPRSHSQIPSSFVLDSSDPTVAVNYCRDPDSTKAPWCYQMTGDRWAFCDIPRCMMSLHVS